MRPLHANLGVRNLINATHLVIANRQLHRMQIPSDIIPAALLREAIEEQQRVSVREFEIEARRSVVDDGSGVSRVEACNFSTGSVSSEAVPGIDRKLLQKGLASDFVVMEFSDLFPAQNG